MIGKVASFIETLGYKTLGCSNPKPTIEIFKENKMIAILSINNSETWILKYLTNTKEMLSLVFKISKKFSCSITMEESENFLNTKVKHLLIVVTHLEYKPYPEIRILFQEIKNLFLINFYTDNTIFSEYYEIDLNLVCEPLTTEKMGKLFDILKKRFNKLESISVYEYKDMETKKLSIYTERK